MILGREMEKKQHMLVLRNFILNACVNVLDFKKKHHIIQTEGFILTLKCQTKTLKLIYDLKG